MIPVSSNYNLQGMSTLNFNNIIANPSQTTLPISALGNILQLHCNPSLTLQVNGTSPMIPVSTKESPTQDQLTTQMNTLRNIFPSQQTYQNVSQKDQCTNSSQRGFNQLIQELLSTYQDQQENLSQLTIKYNFLLNAMERLLFDVQNNVEYSLLALGISQTINKVKLNQINQLNQLNCASLISNGVIPMINQSHLFNNCTQLSTTPAEVTPISSVIDLTNQRTKPDSTTAMASTMDKKVDSTKVDLHALNNSSNSKKLTSLDKLDRLIDETVKKSTNRIPVVDDHSHSPTSKTQVGNEAVQAPVNAINYNMGNAIQQIIRQFYQNTENMGLNGITQTETNFPNLPLISSRSHLEHIKTSMNNFSQQVTEIIGNTAIPFNNLASRTNHSFILCNNLATNSVLNTRREPLVVSMSTTPKDTTQPNINEITNDVSNIIDEIESNGPHDDEDMDPAELDPTEVATRIRDILSLHSIGQRLFAKHVLNLSQGTVSELLSKPKPWSKLSEKGRDSYRKMNQWAQDSARVQELKSIAPRKGFSGHYAGMSPATPIKEDHETQEKIKRILNDAKMAMASTNNNQQTNVDEELYNYTKPNDSGQNNQSNECTQISSMGCNPVTTVSTDLSTNVLEFDISQFQKKIAALQSTVISGSVVTDSLPQISASLNCQQSPLILMNFANLVPSSLVMNSLSQTNPSLVPIVNTHIVANKNPSDSNEIKSEPIINQGYSSDNSEMGIIKCNNINPDNETKPATVNNIESQPPTDHFELKTLQNTNYKSSMEHENFEKLLKSFMNPTKFTDDSLQNEEINTTALVNLIKEHLTKNSISQRTFGCLLGLSQGSISDILSRPKPWSLLTNKGREPYIRMLKYLFKPNNFKISDNGTNKIDNIKSDFQGFPNQSPQNSSSSPTSVAGSREFERNKPFSTDKTSHDLNLLSNNENLISYPDNESYTASRSCSTEGRGYESFDEDIININGELCGREITNFDQLDLEDWKFDDSKERIFNLARRIVDLDTIFISNAVKEILMANNLGQKLFGECILSLSQGSVSELLSKPKSWNQLSFKGKEPYVRMQLWLRQPDKLNILINCQNSHKYKPNFSQLDNPVKKTTISQKIENDVDYELLINNNCDAHINSKGAIRINKFSYKKGRIVFTDSQKAELLSVYEICPYPRTEHLKEISKKLNIPLKTINNWFHNYRMRNKNARCLTTNCTIEHDNYIESLSMESDINSEKSLPLNKDESCINEEYSYDGSESEGSMPAPHLYPESAQLECVSMENHLNDNSFIEEEAGFCANSSLNLCVQNIAGSNKRKRANPIKLEMVVSKMSNKDTNSHYSRVEDSELRLDNSSSTMNSFCSKIPKIE